MRLIDADAVINALPVAADDWTSVVIRLTLENAPTIDPVKHGHWIVLHTGLPVCECSCCSNLGSPNSKYCSVCGAKMDEKGDCE